MKNTFEPLKNDLDDALTHKLRSAGRVAWDIETSGLDPHTDRIGTVQIHAADVGTVIVQVGASAPEHLRQLLEDPGVCKVFHHAMFDLRFMVAHWDARPVHVACTKIASKLLTPQLANGHHSLQSLLAECLNVTLSKEQRLTDWLAPDLTPEQLAYASADVAYLLPLLDELGERLRAAKLSGLYQDCLEFIPARVRLELGDWPDVFTY